MQDISLRLRAEGKKIGFVPTMGYLHDGHLSLVKRSKELADITVVSIFVNPTQFGVNEDLDSYPRDLEGDCTRLEKFDVDYLFNPDAEDIYPANYHTYVEVETLTENLCGRSRPTHFRGVTTIVSKLFNIVLPHYAIFGQKDVQQCYVIKRMTEDLNLLPQIIINPTVRENDGLAMSSRNKYLTKEERIIAPAIYQSLNTGKEIILKGERNADKIVAVITATLEKYLLFRIDYIDIVDTKNLQKVNEITGDVIIAAAVFLSKARLIDNVIVKI